MKIIDANILLRYLLNDEEQSFIKSSQIIDNNDVILTNEIIAEVVYVLEKVYLVPKHEIKTVLKTIVEMRNIIIDDKLLISHALNFYDKHNLDFVDSILLAYNKVRKYQVITYDKKLKRLLSVKTQNGKR